MILSMMHALKLLILIAGFCISVPATKNNHKTHVLLLSQKIIRSMDKECTAFELEQIIQPDQVNRILPAPRFIFQDEILSSNTVIPIGSEVQLVYSGQKLRILVSTNSTKTVTIYGNLDAISIKISSNQFISFQEYLNQHKHDNTTLHDLFLKDIDARRLCDKISKHFSKIVVGDQIVVKDTTRSGWCMGTRDSAVNLFWAIYKNYVEAAQITKEDIDVRGSGNVWVVL